MILVNGISGLVRTPLEIWFVLQMARRMCRPMPSGVPSETTILVSTSGSRITSGVPIILNV